MTRKDFRLIAKAISEVNEDSYYNENKYIDSETVNKVLVHLVYALSDKIKLENPRFNEYDFFDACGLNAN